MKCTAFFDEVLEIWGPVAKRIENGDERWMEDAMVEEKAEHDDRMDGGEKKKRRLSGGA